MIITQKYRQHDINNQNLNVKLPVLKAHAQKYFDNLNVLVPQGAAGRQLRDLAVLLRRDRGLRDGVLDGGRHHGAEEDQVQGHGRQAVAAARQR